MDTKRYNGWANYATWRINLEILDGLDIEDITGVDDKEIGAYDLGNAIAQYVEDVLFGHGECQFPLIESYARAFLDDVNYQEIAQHFLDEV